MAVRSSKGLGAQYDKIILVVALLALLGSVGWMFSGGEGFGFKDSSNIDADGTAAKPYPIAELADTWAGLVSPVNYSYTNRVISSEKRVMCVNTNCQSLIRRDAEICPFCQVEQPKRDGKTDSDADGIPDLIEIAASMDPYNVADASWDCDRDGFTALEEYTYQRPNDGTVMKDEDYNLNDPDVHPPHLSRLRTARIINRPLKFELKRISEIEDGVFSFQVTIIDGRNQYKKLGDTVNGYKIEHYNPEKKLLKIKGPVGVVELARGKLVQLPQRVAMLVIVAETGKPAFKETVQIGSGFVVEGEQFKVVDIKESVVVAESVKSGKIEVPAIQSMELELLKNILSGTFPCGDSGGGDTPNDFK